MPSCGSPTCCGPISRRRISRLPWPPSPGARGAMADGRLPDGATVSTTVQMAPGRSDLGVRVASAAVMLALAGGAIVAGGWILTGFISLVAVATYVELVLLVRRTGLAGASLAASLLAGGCSLGLAALVLATLRIELFVLALGAVIFT